MPNDCCDCERSEFPVTGAGPISHMRLNGLIGHRTFRQINNWPRDTRVTGTEIGVSAYLIFTRDKTLARHELVTYSKQVPATLAGREAKVLASYGSREDLEGASTEGTLIAEVPSIETQPWKR
jgi:hypothetical protein